MPSPIGHAAAGIFLLVIRRRLNDWKQIIQSWREGLWFAFLAALPDVDFFDPGHGWFHLDSPFHHQWSHSIMFILWVALIVFVCQRIAGRKDAWRSAVWSGLAVSSHVLLDMVFSNSRESPLQLFWPFSDRIITAPLHFYYDWNHKQMLSPSNLIQLAAEAAAALAVIVCLLWFYSAKRSRSRVGMIR